MEFFVKHSAVPVWLAPDRLDLLVRSGADRLVHSGGRTLLDHCVGVHFLLKLFGASQRARQAALVHSIYSTGTHELAVVLCVRAFCAVVPPLQASLAASAIVAPLERRTKRGKKGPQAKRQSRLAACVLAQRATDKCERLQLQHVGSSRSACAAQASSICQQFLVSKLTTVLIAVPRGAANGKLPVAADRTPDDLVRVLRHDARSIECTGRSRSTCCKLD